MLGPSTTPSAGSTDADLVRGALTGSQTACAALFDKHSGRLWGLARSLSGGDFDDAHDLLQETFIRAFQHLPSLETPDRLSPWLGSVMRHCAFSRNETRQRRDRLLDQAETEDLLPAPTPRPDQQLLASGIRADIETATRRLTDQSREIFSAFHLEGRTIAEISEDFELSIGAVKARLFHSRKLIRQELQVTMPDRADALPTEMPDFVAVEVMGEHSNHHEPLHPVRLSSSLLSRHLLYACRRQPMDVAQLAESVQVAPTYIEEMTGDLVRGELLEEPEPGQFRSAFLFIERAEWKRVAGHSIVGEALPILRKRVGDLQQAFNQTDMAQRQGYDWQHIAWAALPVWILTRGLGRQVDRLPEWGRHRIFRYPLRPVDFWHALGLANVRLGELLHIGSNSHETDDGGMCRATVVVHHLGREHRNMIASTDQERFVGGLLRGPATRADVLADSPFAEEDGGKLQRYIDEGYIRDLGDGRVELAVPVVSPEDDAILTPVVDDICAELGAGALEHSLSAFCNRVEEEGFTHLLEQPHYLGFVGALAVASAILEACIDDGLLVEPPDQDPNLGCWAWRGGDLMKGWGKGR